MATPESNEVYRRILWQTAGDFRPSTPTTHLPTSPFMQDIICRQCRRHQLPDLVESLPPTADVNIPRSHAIDIPRMERETGRHRHSIAGSLSPEIEFGQELRRIADEFGRTFGSAPGGSPRTSVLNTARRRSLSFLHQFPGFTSKRHRRNSVSE